mgnify:CR=1 FL=1
MRRTASLEGPSSTGPKDPAGLGPKVPLLEMRGRPARSRGRTAAAGPAGVDVWATATDSARGGVDDRRRDARHHRIAFGRYLAEHILLREHDALIRSALGRYRGEEVVHTGDGVVATFDGPTRAVSCAQHLVHALGGIGLTVRIGLHTGEVEVGPDGVSGLAIHLASRVMATATDGGIVISRTVKDLVFGSGIEVVDLGEQQLRGVPGTWGLYRVLDAHDTSTAA